MRRLGLTTWLSLFLLALLAGGSAILFWGSREGVAGSQESNRPPNRLIAAPERAAPTAAEQDLLGRDERRALTGSDLDRVPVDLSLIVLHGDHSRAAGAEIRLAPWTPELRRKLRVEERHPSLLFDAPEVVSVTERQEADEEGRLQWRHDGGPLLIAVRFGEERGSTLWHPGGETEFLLTLQELRPLEVRVVDREGRPIAGVPVSGPEWDPDRPFFSRSVGSDERGIAFFPDSSPGSSLGGPVSSVRVMVAELLDREWPSCEVDFQDWPSAPVELTVPAFGAVEVSVAGLPAGTRGSCRLSILDPMQPRRSGFGQSLRASLEDGRARFPCVALGLELQASVQLQGTSGRFSARGSGPTAAGETVALSIDMSGAPVLTGRLIGEDGQLVSGGRWDAALISEGMESSGDLKLDGDGRFRFSADASRRAGELRAFQIRPEDSKLRDRLEVRVELPPQLPPGLTELGDLRLQAPPLVLSGRVVDSEGRPVEGARLFPEVLFGEYRSEQDWGNAPFRRLLDERGAGGSFQLRGRLDSKVFRGDATTRFRIRAEAYGYFLPEPAPFQLGQQDLSLVLLAGGAVAVAARFPEGMEERRRLKIRLAPAGGGEATVYSRDFGEGPVVLHSLPPDSYNLELLHPSAEEAIARVEGFTVTAGETTQDPRLLPIDLRPALRLATLRVRAADGSPWTQPLRLTWLYPGRGGTGGLRSDVEDGSLKVAFDPSQPSTLMVGADGYRQVLLPEFTGDRELVLGGKIEASLRLTEPLGGAAAGHRVELWIDRYPVAGGPRVLWSRTEVRGQLQREGEVQAVFPGPGLYRWKWTVRSHPESVGGDDFVADFAGGEWRIDDASHGGVIDLVPPPELRAGAE